MPVRSHVQRDKGDFEMKTEIKEKPILFNSEMVRALLDGRKKLSLKKTYCKKTEDHNSPEHLWKRLLNSCIEDESSECWLWLRHTNNDGYGRLTVNGRGISAHRLSYSLKKGDIPLNLNVCHSCDNPRCINPDHLFTGTQSDNMKDCYEKGRSKICPVSFKGEKNTASKLKDKDISEIRKRLIKGEKQSSIARHFNVSQAQISNIKRGRQRK